MTIAPWFAKNSLPLSSKGLHSLAVSADGRHLAVGNVEGHITLRKSDTLETIQSQCISNPVRWMSFLQNTLVTVSEKNTIQAFDMNLQPIGKPYLHQKRLTAFHVSGNAVFDADEAGTITQLNARLELLRTMITSDKITMLMATDDHLWVGTSKGCLLKMLQSGMGIHECIDVTKNVAIRSFALTRTGFAVGSDDFQIHVWNQSDKKFDSSYTAPSKPLMEIGVKLLSSRQRKLPATFDPLKNPQNLSGHEISNISALTTSPCLEKVYSVGVDGNLMLWERDVHYLRNST